MTDPELSTAIQQELMKLLVVVSQELNSISDTLDEIIDVVVGETEQKIGLDPPKPVRWGKVDPIDYGTPSTRQITVQEALAHADQRIIDQRIIEGYALPLTFEIEDIDDDEHGSEGRF